MKKLFIAVVWAGLVVPWGAHAAGLLTPADGRLAALQIRSHHVDVVIEDGYAVTQVEQVFHNPHDRELEAVYSFPVPKHGSVAEFTMWIDGKAVSGEVLEAKEARRVYEEEKAAGRDAGITEKDAYKTFDIRVYPVRPQQDTKIRLVYFQPAHVDTGIGRYVYPLEEGGVDEQKLAFWTAEEAVTASFEFNVHLRSAYPVAAVRVPHHNAVITDNNDGTWQVQLAAAREGAQQGPAYKLDKDMVVYWRHKEDLPGSLDLVAYKPDKQSRGTFMMVVTPGDDLQPITEGKDWVFVLDISGSMSGKYATLAQGVKQALGKMRADDRFYIVLFNDHASQLTPRYINASAEAVNEYADKIAAVQPRGSTNMYAGIAEGLRVLDRDRTSAMVLVTDGVANVGVTEQQRFLHLINDADVRLFTAIMGNSANEPLLGALTKASHGFAANVSNSDDIVGKVLEMTTKVTHEALHGVDVEIAGVKTADIAPHNLGSLYRGQQLVMFGHYWDGGMADVRLTGKISGRDKTYSTRFNFPSVALENPEIERLWAYAQIEDLTATIQDFGEDADNKQAIIDLGTEYSLVTDYTSMVVVADEVFRLRGIDRRNQARLQNEHAAQNARSQRAPVSRRADQSEPMYRKPRPGYRGFGGGGGATGPWLLLALPLLLFLKRKTTVAKPK